MVTTIQLDEDVKGKLDELKIHRRETYNELLMRLIDDCSFGDVDKESLIETVEVLSSPETMRRIAKALDSINDPDRWIPFENVKKEFGLS